MAPTELYALSHQLLRLFNHFLQLCAEHVHRPFAWSQRSSVIHCHQSVISPWLFVNGFDRFIYYSAGEAIDRHMDPVMLLPFHHEIILQIVSIGLVVA